MGWPRKNDGERLYQEKSDKSYILVCVENGQNGSGKWDAVANAYEGPNPSLCTVGVDALFLLNCCRRVEWSDLPDNWKNALQNYMTQGGDSWNPNEVRGLWKVGNMPTPTSEVT